MADHYAPEEISTGELAAALEEGRRKGQEWLKGLKDLRRDKQVEWLAEQIYIIAYVNPHGYPNGLPTWHELPDVTQSGNIDKERFLQAAEVAMRFVPWMELEKR